MAAFKLNVADLAFVLKQIKIAEANSAAHSGAAAVALTNVWADAIGNTYTINPATDLPYTAAEAAAAGLSPAIPSPMAPFGLRTVDGSFNNIVDGRETWGSADQAMPRLLPSYYRNEADGDQMPLGPPGSGAPTITNNNYGANGSVADADPRLISNLVSDMSFNNPAAIVAALAFAEFNGEWSGDVFGEALPNIQAAFAALQVVLGETTSTEQQISEANDAFDAVLAGYAVTRNGNSVDIPNIAPDEGLSVPFNAWMTFFGQFFDHGLDLINKGGNGTVYVPLAADDPLRTHGPDGIAGNGDEVPDEQAFMVLTRATPNGDTETNLTTPVVDQNQTYTSDASHQVFLREYELVGGIPLATGNLLDGSDANDAVSSLPTWADTKAQAANLLGIGLTDRDVGSVPVLRVDPYGEFVRGPNGLPQILAGVDSDGESIWVEGDLANPVDPSAIQLPVGIVLLGGNVIEAGETVSAVRSGNAFLDDIAHNAAIQVVDPDRNPFTNNSVWQTPDDDSDTGNAIALNEFGVRLTYDDDLLNEHFITGDGRGNENIGLTAVHSIFHSEHNRQVEQQKLTIFSSNDLAFVNEWLREPITQEQLTALQSVSPLDQIAFADTLSWDGERLFQGARVATEMQYQHLVFEEFARKIQPNIDPFVFNTTPDINPVIFSEFANVVYRFGHSMLTENMPRIDGNGVEVPAMKADGTPMTAAEFGLVAAFLNPVSFDNNGALTDDQGAAAIIRGMTIERGNEIDEFLVDALRNNLLGLPLDLGAINIARGRDTGMPSLNQAREALYNASGSTFLEPYANWTDFAANLKNPVSVINFIAAYGTHPAITGTAAERREAAWNLVMGGSSDPIYDDRMAFLSATGDYDDKGGLNEIDLWIGGLAEKKMPFGGFLGSTFNAVFELQLENLQDGDRFYYLTRTQGQNFLTSLEQNSFAKMMMANTDLAKPGADGIRGTPDDIIDRHIGVDSFGVYDYVLEVNIDNQADYTPVTDAERNAANAALVAAQSAYTTAVGNTATANADPNLPLVYAVEQQEYLDAQDAADAQDAVVATALAALLAAVQAPVDAFYQDNLTAAYNAYTTEVGIDAGLNTAAATALQEAVDALNADVALDDAIAAEAAALAARNAAQAAVDAIVAADSGKDPIGNNPVLEAAGLGKVSRRADDPLTVGVDESLYIRVQGGEHVVVGGTNGNDTIITDFGDDGIWGDAGDDRIESGAGVDLVNGGGGNDILTDSGDSFDFIKGDEGDDVISGGNGLDILMGGDGNDVVFHGVDDTETFGGQGDDFIMGGAGVDIMLGGEGDDWIEGGAGFDNTSGDNSDLFFDSQIIGHDVLFSGSEEHDFDAESGDDIMVQGESVLRNEGQFGFDWVTYKDNPQNADVDLAKPIFTTEVADVLRDRFDKVEAASGFTGNDLLVGDDRVYDATATGNITGTAEGVFFRDDINQAGIDRITGLDQIITNEDKFSGIYTSEFGDLKPGATAEQIFAGGNVLIGGAGDDTLIGKGGNDILDGDRWLNVRIRITAPGDENTADNELATIDSLTHVFTADQLTALGIDPVHAGRALSALLVDRLIVPSQMHIVREILDGDAGNTANDTAVFWDIADNYTVVEREPGTFVVTHDTVTAGGVLPPGFKAATSDGVDVIRNIETLRFGNGAGGFIDYTLAERVQRVATGAAIVQDLASGLVDTTPTEGQTLSVNTASIADANGIASLTIEWQSSADGLTGWTTVGTGATLALPDAPGTATTPLWGQYLKSVVTVVDNLGGPLSTTVIESAVTDRVGQRFSTVVAATFTGPDTNDTVLGSGAADILNGGWGNDFVQGGAGDDFLRGGRGNDIVAGQGGNDTVAWMYPVAGYTFTTVGNTANLLVIDNVALSGTDEVRTSEFLQFTDGTWAVVPGATNGNDTLGVAGTGSQAIFGRNGADTLNGNAGRDILVGGAGNDTVNGGDDDDFIYQVGSTDGRDFIDGGNGIDTYTLSGVAGAETFNIYAKADAITAGFGAGLNANTEIVITRNGVVIAELDNIEEIRVSSLLTQGEVLPTAENFNGTVDGGTLDGDTVNIIGNFAAPFTSLQYNTIRVNGSNANDTVNISGLASDHRVVFTTNGGSDTIVGAVRDQDIVNGAVTDLRTSGFGAQDGLDAMVGSQVQTADLGTSGSAAEASLTMVDTGAADFQPLDLVDAGPVIPVIVHEPVFQMTGSDFRQFMTDYQLV